MTKDKEDKTKEDKKQEKPKLKKYIGYGEYRNSRSYKKCDLDKLLNGDFS